MTLILFYSLERYISFRFIPFFPAFESPSFMTLFCFMTDENETLVGFFLDGLYGRHGRLCAM